MAYSETLAGRIRVVMQKKQAAFVEKKMMGGLCVMVDDKMCFGVMGDDLMARVGAENYEQALKRIGCRPMDFTGRPLKGFVYVDAAAIDTAKGLGNWIQLCLDYNPHAKRSNPRRKK